MVARYTRSGICKNKRQLDMKKIILLTSGEPAGIGPDICLDLAYEQFSPEENIIIILADIRVLQIRASQMDLHDIEFIRVDKNNLQQYKNQENQLLILDIPCINHTSICKIDIQNTPYVLQLLDTAINLCKQGISDTIVTAPISKESINQYGIKFSGHTEYFAQAFNVPKVVMMLRNTKLNVALLTTHLPLREVANHITTINLDQTIQIIIQSFTKLLGNNNPKIAVCGLKPHAGEGGYLGMEEIETINPIIKKWQQNGYNVSGSYPADTIFTYADKFDVVLAMYNDQGLPVLKYADFANGINITLGLPILRVSVDHGTALDLAGSGKANSRSLICAIEFAILKQFNHT